MLTGALDQVHHQHYRGVQHTGDGPDEPTVPRLAVAGGAEGVPHEDSRHQQPVDGADRALDAAAGFLLAGIVALLQQPLHGGVDGAAIGEGHAADTGDDQQQAHRRHIDDVGGLYAHGDEERHRRQDAQHRAGDIQPGVGVGEVLHALLHHAADAVLRLEGVLLQKGEVPYPGRAGEEQRHADGHQHQQPAQADAGRGIFGDTEAGHLAHGGQHQQRHRGDDAQEGGQRHPRRGGTAERQIGGGLLHGDPPQGRLVHGFALGVLLDLQLVLLHKVGGDAEQAAHLHHLIHIGDGLGALPLGDRLAADVQPGGQLLLGPAGLLPQCHDFVR